MSPATAAIDVIDFQPEKAKTVGLAQESEAQALVASTTSLDVVDISTLERAVIIRQEIGERQKKIVDFFKPLKDAAYRMHRAICQRESDVLGPLETLDRKIRSNISDFKTAQDRLREEKERALGEQRRREEQERAMREAVELERVGDTAQAAAVMEEAIAAPMPIAVLPDETKAVEGLKFRREWKWRFATSEARALELIPRNYLSVDAKKIGQVVRAMKGSTSIPGIQVYFEDLPIR